jgi:hypothetical protein
MTPKEKKELWSWAVLRKAYDLSEMITELMTTYKALINDANIDGKEVEEAFVQLINLEVEAKFLYDLINNVGYNPLLKDVYGQIPLHFREEKEITDEELQNLIKTLIEIHPLLPKRTFDDVWKEYQRCVNIYKNADSRKKLYLVAEAVMQYSCGL